jgi:hypothetical protein
METINTALGISEEWRSATDKKIEQLIDDEGLVSDVMEKMITAIKEEEFGEGEYEITSYEKKLTYMGFMILSELMAREHAEQKLKDLLTMLSSFHKDDNDEE